MSWYMHKPYVPVAARRAHAQREVEAMVRKGQNVRPVHIEGREIARTFWGIAWCEHLESYSDFASRLPKGRTYVRNGSVCDLQIEPCQITALVCGSELYRIKIKIKPLAEKKLASVKKRCAGQIGSLIELLQGKLSSSVMKVITGREDGLFPHPDEIDMNCSCPDWAGMCKHLAACLYGVGARLDESPELLFKLRNVDQLQLLSEPANINAMTQVETGQKTIAADALGGVFGIEFDPVQPATKPAPPSPLPRNKTRSLDKIKSSSKQTNPDEIKKPTAMKHARSKSKRK